ncbi:hypothetical protein D7X33_20565 [Butyricicoccus sp. 1XD8-22]|nr:hypothetical protein D7X33_20565 [Butyricicoccus sp. 1XD8-22]
MVPFPLSRSPHPSSGPFPTYCKPARPAPPGRAAQRLAKLLRRAGHPRGTVLGSACRPRSRSLQPVPLLAQGGFLRCRARLSPGGLLSLYRYAVSPAAAKKARRGLPLPAAPTHPSATQCFFGYIAAAACIAPTTAVYYKCTKIANRDRSKT